MPYTDYNTLPQFLSADATEIEASARLYYEGLVGKPLLDAQTEALMIQVLAYREQILRADFNDAARKMLLDFSSGTLLDYIVALVAVKRLGQQYATTTLQFTLAVSHTGSTIPALTRVQSSDGKVSFQTNASSFVPAGTYTIDVPATATEPGVDANGYTVGGINNILDPQPFLLEAQNTTVTEGGADAESDERLVERTKLAPSAYSSAGPYDAYRFWAMTAHPTITDVKVLGPGDYPGILGGQVKLYVLVPGVVTPAPVLTAVENICSADLKRPLCDDVEALSAEKVDYDVVINMTLYRSADANATMDSAGQRVNDYCQARKAQMSQDVMIDQLKAIACADIKSVYKAEVLINGVAADLIISPIQYSYIGTITTNVVGLTNG